MIKISCYKTKQDQLSKAFCHLAQKCYYSSMNTCVITNNSDFKKILGKYTTEIKDQILKICNNAIIHEL